ncbi:MAG: glycosyl hydrolase [Gemmatimonadetes bacterium]|nr:glycosyl hydrolase [Gemmatimonadota bacterium]
MTKTSAMPTPKRNKYRRHAGTIFLFSWTFLSPSTAASLSGQAAITTEVMSSMYPRSIGPAVTGGRIHDVEALPTDPSTVFVGTASGGLWKSTNRGQTWVNVFADKPVSTFGDIAISRSDPKIMYAGTGEQQNRQSSSYGNGIYRSNDGGDTWAHLGLEQTRHTGRIVIHPTNPDIVYFGAVGNLWAGSEHRGVFKSTDGGQNWDKVLFVDQFSGVIDMAIDPHNPNTIYAATYQRLRRAWGFNGGGPGSGIWKSTDGGQNWTRLGSGLPEGDLGRIGVAVAESNPDVVMAIVEAEDNQSGVYRSEDAGLSWKRVNQQNIRPMYYSHIFIDPNDDKRVYTLATRSYFSDDGGETFSQIALAPTYDVGIHADHHSLWINPSDPEHLFLAGDAGLHESYDRGINFRKLNNFPISQFYAIGVDMRDPYWVYGGLQDNHSFFGPSETRRWAGILNDDWMQNGFGDGMFWQADPDDARYSYGSSNGGNYFRYDTQTGDMLDISPEPPVGQRYRFDWTSPMMLSQHDSDRLYVAGNSLFVSEDRGGSWSTSEDMSRQVDRDTLQIMDVLGADITISRNDGTSSFGEAVTLDESPLDIDVLWVGFDDGNLQVSRNGGTTWAEVSSNVPGLADGTYVSRIVASFTSAGTAYATFDAHRDGDFRPYVYRTHDFGSSWEPLHANLPEMGSVNVLVEHPDNPSTLFVGTEHHVLVSTDAGENWARVPNLPTTNYDDMVIHPREKDLVIGSHGQGVWILDDTRAIAEWSDATNPVTVFSIPNGTIKLWKKDTSYRGQDKYAGTNPVDGVEVTYRLINATNGATMRVHAADGTLVRELTVPGSAGTHRVHWDLRHGGPDVAGQWSRHNSPVLARSIEAWGPWVSPGTYTVSIQAGDQNAKNVVEVRGDPEMPMLTQKMYEDRERFMLDAIALTTRISRTMRDFDLNSTRGDSGFRNPTGSPRTPGEMLRTARRLAQQVYGALNGGGVRPGSLYPPTQTQREQLLDAQELLSQAIGELREDPK